MNKKKGVVTTILLGILFTVGCSNYDNGTSEDANNITTEYNNITTEYIEGDVSKDTYTFDTSLDKKEHTFNIEDERPIIEAFTESMQGMSLQEIEELFKRCGNDTISDIYTIEPSEYEMFDVTVVNNEGEEVSVTYKDGNIISKKYKKDTFDDTNKNIAFVNYKSNLFKQEYSSGIYLDDINSNIAKNKNVWEIEEEVFKIFN